MVVEIPRGSTNKYEYDLEGGLFRLDRPLHSPIHYPGDYGFVPGTLAEDGDPLDILALVDEPSYPGILLAAWPVGILDLTDQNEVDSKILAVSHRNPRFDEIHSADDVMSHTLREIEHFFSIYKELEGKRVNIRGWRSMEEARSAIQQARARYTSLRT
jgi:inorganic pyrophosphatase